MKRYEEKIEEALLELRVPSKVDAKGGAPIIYLVYPPEDTFVMRDIVDSFLTPKAEYLGFKVHYVNMGDLIDKYITNHDYLDFWTDSSTKEGELYHSIQQEIEKDHYFENALLNIQKELVSEVQPLIVLRDVGMLHPFYMMNNIENNIYNKIQVPILVLYPGEAQGTARSFLCIYSQDGNYRSISK